MSPQKGSQFMGHSHVVNSNAFTFAFRSNGPSTFISTLLVEQGSLLASKLRNSFLFYYVFLSEGLAVHYTKGFQ